MTSVHPDPLRFSAMPESEERYLGDQNMKGKKIIAW